MGKHFEKVMNEMCNRVEANWKEVDTMKEKWYKEYSWTEEEQDSFAEWFVNYLINNKEAREEILNHPIKDKVRIEKAVNEFLFNYGWLIK